MGNAIEHCQTCKTHVMCHMERRCMALPPVAERLCGATAGARNSDSPAVASPRPCSAWVDAATPPEKDGWYLVWVMPGDETNGYVPTFEKAFWTKRIEDWEPADSCGPLSDGCYVSHWGEVFPPNDSSAGIAAHEGTTV